LILIGESSGNHSYIASGTILKWSKINYKMSLIDTFGLIPSIWRKSNKGNKSHLHICVLFFGFNIK